MPRREGDERNGLRVGGDVSRDLQAVGELVVAAAAPAGKLALHGDGASLTPSRGNLFVQNHTRVQSAAKEDLEQ